MDVVLSIVLGSSVLGHGLSDAGYGLVPMLTRMHGSNGDSYSMYHAASMYGDGHILLSEIVFQNYASGSDLQPDCAIGLLSLAVMLSLAYR